MNGFLGSPAPASQGNQGRWILQITVWIFAVYLIIAQCIPALDYELGACMGTQETALRVTNVGVAYWWAFAFADLVFYAPLIVACLVGHALRRVWGRILLAAALGITIYWPLVSLAAVAAARDVSGWDLPSESQYWIILPWITLWSAWSLWNLIGENPGSAQV